MSISVRGLIQGAPEYMPMAVLVGSPALFLRNSRLCTLSKTLGRCLDYTQRIESKAGCQGYRRPSSSTGGRAGGRSPWRGCRGGRRARRSRSAGRRCAWSPGSPAAPSHRVPAASAAPPAAPRAPARGTHPPPAPPPVPFASGPAGLATLRSWLWAGLCSAEINQGH